MKKNRDIYLKYIYTMLFGLLILIPGVISFSKLMDHYINDRPDYHEWVPELGTRFETDLSNNFFSEFSFVNFNGFMHRILGHREMNGVIRLENDYLYRVCPYYLEEEMNETVDHVKRLNDYLAERGVPFVYLITPSTLSKYYPCLPAGVTDYANQNKDRLYRALTDRGIDVIDLREELHNDGIDQYSMMYRTDHHWTTRMGFYTYEKIIGKLEKCMPCDIDPAVKNINNYTVTTYPGWHLGSRGQRTGEFFGGIDDFDLITPDFDTFIMTADGEKTGSFSEILIDTKPLVKKDIMEMREDPSDRSIYDRVLERTKGEFVNLNSKNDKHILMITDSFGDAVMPYMDISFERVKWVEGNVDSRLINEFEPDAVIMIYDMSDNFIPYLYEYSLD